MPNLFGSYLHKALSSIHTSLSPRDGHNYFLSGLRISQKIMIICSLVCTTIINIQLLKKTITTATTTAPTINNKQKSITLSCTKDERYYRIFLFAIYFVNDDVR
jgi:hypothetical protein